MPTLSIRIDPFAAFTFRRCQGCEKEAKCHQWKKISHENCGLWLCLECWLDLLSNLREDKEKIHLDNNGVPFVGVVIQDEKGVCSPNLIALRDIERKIQQVLAFQQKEERGKK